MRLNKKLAFAVELSVFSERFGIPMNDLAQMIAAANASARAWERDDDEREQKMGTVVEEIAAKYGCKIDWPGLWPTVAKKGCGESLLPSYN